MSLRVFTLAAGFFIRKPDGFSGDFVDIDKIHQYLYNIIVEVNTNKQISTELLKNDNIRTASNYFRFST
jgi:hypothetical protein